MRGTIINLLEGGDTYGLKSSCSMSNNSLANSTPVGPPPATTKDNSSFLSSSEIVGKQALSKLSMILFRIPLASAIVLRKEACSNPSTP